MERKPLLSQLVPGLRHWAAAGVLMVAAVGAQATEATLLADRAGFLLGHGYRCGVDNARLQRAGGRIGDAIAAFARDDDDRKTATTALAERTLASALAPLLGDPLPSCRAVAAALARLEGHRRPVMAQSGGQPQGGPSANARSRPLQLQPARSGSGAAAVSKKRVVR